MAPSLRQRTPPLTPGDPTPDTQGTPPLTPRGPQSRAFSGLLATFSLPTPTGQQLSPADSQAGSSQGHGLPRPLQAACSLETSWG